MIVTDLQPASIVEDKGFQDFLKVIDPKYIPPSRRTIMRDHLPNLYDLKKRELHERMTKSEYCSLTTDLWTSRATQGFMTVTCHFLTEDWELKSAVLETVHVDEAHTADNLASILTRITDEWNITDKVCCVTTDNAANIVAAVKLIKWNHLPCFAHTINLIVSNSLDEVPEVASLIQSCKNIVSFFHKSTKATDKLKIIQNRLNIEQHKLIQHVDTRWNSVFYMLERLLEQEEAVRTTLCLLDRSQLNISTDKIEIIRELVEILRPFEAVTREMSAELYISISKIIPLSRALQRLTVVYTGASGDLSHRLTVNMRRRFLNMEGNILLAGSTLLDPRFKKLAFSDQGAADKAARSIAGEAAAFTQSSLSSCGQEVVEETLQVGNSGSGESLWQFLDQRVAESSSRRLPNTEAISEIQQYLRIHNINRKEDPLKWWKDNTMVFPTIQKVVTKYLVILATSVPSERLFSKAGELVSAKRSRLKPQHINMFLFLNKCH